MTTKRSEAEKKYQPGFQGSETSGIEFVVYPHGDDPVISDHGDPQGQGPIIMNGRVNDAGEQVSLTRMNYEFGLGDPAPTWSISYKDPDTTFPLSSFFVDDDWVDLSVLRHGEPYHLVRGILDGPPALEEVVANDATSRTYRLSGQGFGGVWRKTPIYFNAAIGEIAELNANQSLADANAFGDGAPSTLVDAYLFHFLRQLGDSTVGTSWQFPGGIPNVDKGAFFSEVIDFQPEGSADAPERFAVLPNFYPDFTGNNIWDLAQQWSDPQFNELLPVLLNKSTQLRPQPGEILAPDNSTMALLMRRRPFPYENDLDTWFNLETVVITPQDVIRKNIRRNGAERVNNFVVKSKGFNEITNQLQEMLTSLINQPDIKRHGLRRHEVTTNFVASGDAANTLGVLEDQRLQIRDWFGLNAYYFSGELGLARGFPEIQPGYRLRLKGVNDDDQITFYVERVQHTWTDRKSVV